MYHLQLYSRKFLRDSHYVPKEFTSVHNNFDTQTPTFLYYDINKYMYSGIYDIFKGDWSWLILACKNQLLFSEILQASSWI